MKKIFFVFFFLIIDLTFSQLFLLNFLEKNIVNANKESFENRIFNKDYKYTFKKSANFNSQYYGNIYKVSTNDLGFRDESSRPLNRNEKFSIVIGDSFVEGVGLEYDDTLVGKLNKNSSNLKEKIRFLNAGVSSYSSYIYLKKIKTILDDNPDLKIKDVIVMLDKSDVLDDEMYLNRPNIFKNTKGKFIHKRKEDFFVDLQDLSFWRFYTKQTISGKMIKIFTDILENFFSNLNKRISLSKKLNKSFFQITDLEIMAIKSINNRPYIKNWFVGAGWENKAKKNIIFSIENLKILKDYLDKKNINLIVVLYPWSFEIEDEEARDRYLDFIIPLLENNKIKTLSVYDEFLKENIYKTIGKNFIYNDVHFNGSGYKIIADRISTFLNK